MCRLSGIIFNGNPDWKILMKMADHQHKGGPDHCGIWQDGNVGLAHNRLSIIDLSDNGNQPMHTDRWVLSFVGEIYNYQELKTKISPRAWESHGDTETLLFYIDEKGIEKTLQDIEGMYAIAAYDKIDKMLYLAVDPYSIKSLYWFKSDGLFAFASSPGALSFCKDQWTLDKNDIQDFLALGATREPLFKGMRKMKGGEIVVYDVQREMTSISKYYQPKHYDNLKPSDLIDQVKHSIQSVKVADVPVFMFLSGGIDSTVVASQCQYMNAVHLASPEEQYAAKVANKYNNQLSFINPRDFSARESLEDYSLQSGDCSMAAIIPYITSKEVSRFGKVGISANGADELFFGYDRILDKSFMVPQLAHIFRAEFLVGSGWPTYEDPRELELNTYVQYDLNKTLDFASMCHGLEVRVPFLNKTVVEMALSLNREQHVGKYGNKTILKEFLLSEGFDRAFTDRAKIGFSLHKEPSDYLKLQNDSVEWMKKEFGIELTSKNGRDKAYFRASAAALYCWFKVWGKLKFGL